VCSGLLLRNHLAFNRRATIIGFGIAF